MLSIRKDNRINWKLTSQNTRNVYHIKAKWEESKKESYIWKPSHSENIILNQIKKNVFTTVRSVLFTLYINWRQLGFTLEILD